MNSVSSIRTPQSQIRNRWKRSKKVKVIVALCSLIALSQIPLLYRRHYYSNLKSQISNLRSHRQANLSNNLFKDYKGVMHVHSVLGGHSTGSFADIVAAAQSNKLDFVVMTEHPSRYHDTAEATLQGLHDGVLFVKGNEVGTETDDHLLTVAGRKSDSALAARPPTREVIAKAQSDEKLIFISHPEEFRSWEQTSGYHGMEIYNLHASARRVKRLRLVFDGLWSFSSYPELLFTIFHHQPVENLQRWDALTQHRKVVGVAGNDAHANLGFSLEHATGKKIFSLQLDPYHTTFQVVRTHVLVRHDQPFNQETLLGALKDGHCYVSFDVLSDPTGFQFIADNGSETKIMGDDIQLRDEVRFTVRTPLASHILLIKDGKVIDEQGNTANGEFDVHKAGVYRVEVRLDQLAESLANKPWIISNPIYGK